MLLEMRVFGLAIDPFNNTPIMQQNWKRYS